MFLLCEFGLRLLKPARVVGVAHMPCIYEIEEDYGYSYVPNARGWMHRYFEIDNTVEINSQGFHDVDHDLGAEGKGLRIAAIGDSFTAALEVPVSSTWTQILQKYQTQSRGSGVQVINLGLDGTGTDVHLNILKSYLESYTADVVLLAFYANDLGDMRSARFFREVYKGYVVPFQNDEQKRRLIDYIEESRPSSPACWLYENSYLCRAIMNRSSSSRLLRKNLVSPHKSGLEMSCYTDESLAERFTRTFEEFGELSREHGFTLLVVPVPGRDEPGESMTTLVEHLPLEVREALTIVDVFPTLDELLKEEQVEYSDLFWKYDNHFNFAGNRLFGVALARIIAERNL